MFGWIEALLRSAHLINKLSSNKFFETHRVFKPKLINHRLDSFCIPTGVHIPLHTIQFINHRSYFTPHHRIEPRYQEIASQDIAEASKDGIKVRVIAGEALGTKSPIYTRTPTMYLDFTLKPGSHLEQPIPISWNAFVYVLEGEGIFGNSRSLPVAAHHLLLLGGGDGLEVWNKSGKALRFVLVGGEPLGEPVVQVGPFVMNSQEEIDQTVEDYENCINGFEKARHWRS